ncbi:MAG: SLAC1 anion channel family protein [Thiobacillus sp.]|nr:SLAC1 anion channel family protein [Thiobacillus sp.]
MNDAATHSRLQHFPIAWFSMIMGLGGLTIAWRRAEELMGLGVAISPWLLGLTTLLFVALAGAYGVKMLKYRDAAAREWAHPVKMNFVPTVSIALILLSIGWLPLSAPYSKLLWLAGSALHLVLTLHVMTQWMHHSKFEIVHLNPAWFIPVVGNILVPIAGVNHAPAEISWFFFSIGLLFWPVLLTIIFYRVIFHGSLPERLMPTLFILIAPPAVGFLSYVKLTGGLDMLALLFYYSALFFTLLLFAQLAWFARLKFFLSWWAYSFPLAAVTVATFVMYELGGNLLFARLASILLGVATVVIAGLFLRTALAVAKREICLED